jgi:archaellum component FlaC
MSRLPVAGGLFQEQEGLASTLADKLGVLGNKSKDVQEEQEELAQSVQTVDSEFAKLSPLVQQAAQAWGLYGVETVKATQGQQQQLAYLQQLDSDLEPARQGIIDLATANGVDLRTALNMTDEDMRYYVLGLAELGPTAEQAAEETAAAAQKFSEAWQGAFEKSKAGIEEWAGIFGSATENVFKEMGGKMKVGLDDLEKEVKGSFGFNQQFWEELFPEQIADAMFNKPMERLPELVDDMKDTINRAVDKGFINEDDAARWFDPLLDFVSHELPGRFGEGIGYLAAAMPDLAEKLRPKLVFGVIELGADAVEAIQNSLVDPIAQILSKGMGAEEAGPAMVNHLRSILPQIAAFSPDMADAFSTVFVDPLTQQTRPMKEQVGQLLAILGEISPEMEEQVLAIDEDADGLADIFDKEILSAADTMKLGILEAFKAIAESMGDTKWADRLQAAMDRVTGAAEPVVKEFGALQKAVDEGTEVFDPFHEGLMGIDSGMKDLVGSVPLVTGKVEGFTQAEWDLLSPVEKVQAQLDAHQKALDAVSGSATNTTTQVNGLTSAFDKLITSPGAKQFSAFLHPNAAGTDQPAVGPAPPPELPAPNTDPARQEMAQFYTDMGKAWDDFWNNLKNRNVELPPPGRSLIDQAMGDIFVNILQAWSSFWEGLKSRNVEMPPPGSNILMTALGDVFVDVSKAWGDFWNGLKQRDTQMPAPKSNILMTALGGIISTIAKTWGDFWNGLQKRKTELPAPGSSILQQSMTNLYDKIKKGWDDFWNGLKGRELPKMDPNKSLLEEGAAEITVSSLRTGTPLQPGTYSDIPPKPPDFSQHMIEWNKYQEHVNTVVNQIGQHMIRLATGYSLLSQGISTAFQQVIGHWSSHNEAVSGQVNRVGQQIIRLATGYGLLSTGVNSAFGQISNHWSSHVSDVSGQVNRVGQQLLRLATGYSLLASGIRTALNAGNSAWTQHRGAVQQAVSNGISSVSRLASAVASNMSRIVSSMGAATSAAGRLRSAINSLQSRTITVTTRYRTVGSPGGGGVRAAKGFSGVVTQPTRIFTGEGNRPELVQVTPLSPNASGGVKMNQAASSTATAAPGVMPGMNRIFSQPTVRAGGSKNSTKGRVDNIIITPEGDVYTFYARGGRKEGAGNMRPLDDFRTYSDWVASSAKRLKNLKGLKGSETLKKLGERAMPTSWFVAKGLEATTDPLMRSAKAGGTVGRGGKSLFDLGVASPGSAMTRWVVEEKRYKDGSYRRRYSDGSIEFGQDKFTESKNKGGSGGDSISSSQGTHRNLRYITNPGRIKDNKSIRDIRLYEDKSARVIYSDGETQGGFKHNFKGPFTSGDRLIKAASGFQGMVTKPTTISVGEKGAEFVSVQPMTQGGGRGGGAGGGSPVIVEQHITLKVSERELINIIRKAELKGIYAMT